MNTTMTAEERRRLQMKHSSTAFTRSPAPNATLPRSTSNFRGLRLQVIPVPEGQDPAHSVGVADQCEG